MTTRLDRLFLRTKYAAILAGSLGMMLLPTYAFAQTTCASGQQYCAGGPYAGQCKPAITTCPSGSVNATVDGCAACACPAGRVVCANVCVVSQVGTSCTTTTGETGTYTGSQCNPTCTAVPSEALLISTSAIQSTNAARLTRPGISLNQTGTGPLVQLQQSGRNVLTVNGTGLQLGLDPQAGSLGVALGASDEGQNLLYGVVDYAGSHSSDALLLLQTAASVSGSTTTTTRFRVDREGNVASSGGWTTAGGITAGSGSVGIVNSSGKIPELSSTYIADLSGANLTNLNATNLTLGAVPIARIPGTVAKLGVAAKFTGPASATWSTASLVANPATATSDHVLLAAGVGATEVFRVDKEGDVTAAGSLSAPEVRGTRYCFGSDCRSSWSSVSGLTLQESLPGTTQTGNFHISGSGVLDNAVSARQVIASGETGFGRLSYNGTKVLLQDSSYVSDGTDGLVLDGNDVDIGGNVTANTLSIRNGGEVGGAFHAGQLCIGSDCRSSWAAASGSSVRLQGTYPGTADAGSFNVSGSGRVGTDFAVLGTTTLGTAGGSSTVLNAAGSNFYLNGGGNIQLRVGTTGAVALERFSVNNGANAEIFSVDEAGALDVAGGIVAGTGNVQIVNAAGKIPVIAPTTFANLSGVNLTNLNATQLTAGTVNAARLPTTLTQATTFTGIPAGTGVLQGSLVANPASATANHALLGVAVNSVAKFAVDAEGDVAAAGDVTAGRLCIGSDCRSTWPSAGVPSVALQESLPGTTQTGNFHISGSGVLDNAVSARQVIASGETGFGRLSYNGAKVILQDSSYVNDGSDGLVLDGNDVDIGGNVTATTLSIRNGGEVGGAFHAGQLCIGSDCRTSWSEGSSANAVLLQAATPGTIQSGNINVNGTARFGTVIVGSITGTGSGLSSLNAGNISTGTLAAARLPFNQPVVLTGVPVGAGVSQASLVVNPATAVAGRALLGVGVGGAYKFLVDAEGDAALTGSLVISGGLIAGSGVVPLIDTSGKIASLSSSTLANLSGEHLLNLNASQLTSGTVDVARLPTSILVEGESGASLTNLNASQLTTGTLASSRLPDTIEQRVTVQASPNGSRIGDAVLRIDARDVGSGDALIGVAADGTKVFLLNAEGDATAAGDLTGRRICIGDDCREEWPTSSGSSSGAVQLQSTFPGTANTGNFNVSGSGRVGGVLQVANTTATALDVAGGIEVGSGNVRLVDVTGKISGITAATFANLSGINLTNLSAGNLTGTVDTARLPASVILEGDSGATLTSLNASQLTSGLIPDARIPGAIEHTMIFKGVPTGDALLQGSAVVNPPTAPSNYTLLGVAVGGASRFRVDADGDVAAAGAVSGASVCINGDCRTTWPSGSGSGSSVQLQGGTITSQTGGLGVTGAVQVGTLLASTSPTGSGITQGVLTINPATASAGRTLLGVAVGGTWKASVDADGDFSASNDITAGRNMIATQRFQGMSLCVGSDLCTTGTAGYARLWHDGTKVVLNDSIAGSSANGLALDGNDVTVAGAVSASSVSARGASVYVGSGLSADTTTYVTSGTNLLRLESARNVEVQLHDISGVAGSSFYVRDAAGVVALGTGSGSTYVGGTQISVPTLLARSGGNITGDLTVSGNVSVGRETITQACTATGTCTATCSSGKVILGGGCKPSSGIGLKASYPVTANNGWTCEYNGSTNISTYAICARLSGS